MFRVVTTWNWKIPACPGFINHHRVHAEDGRPDAKRHEAARLTAIVRKDVAARA
jgi:hypothetical protein